MAETTADAIEPNREAEHGDQGNHAVHDNPFLLHHFDHPKHQYESGKLGIWLFLVTEVLFFSGLFCLYAIYRSQHPEVFVWAHYYLDTKLGAINTVILLVSSLTAAVAVRAAQLGQRQLLLYCLGATLVCAFGFLDVKYLEYSQKFEHGLLPGAAFHPHEPIWKLASFKAKHPAAAKAALRLAKEGAAEPSRASALLPVAPAIAPASPDVAAALKPIQAATTATPNLLDGLTREEALPLLESGVLGKHATRAGELSIPRNAHAFFGIYFVMTGLHGIHVLAGIAVFSWIFWRAWRGEFGPGFFGPVDYAALYWHLVDLVWIFLFPLLYLIH